MNVELLQQIADKAEAYPRSVSMHTWGQHVSDDEHHPCGTIACIAGTAVLLQAPALFNILVGSVARTGSTRAWEEAGAAVLDITMEQAALLFYYDGWPEPFRTQYVQAIEETERPDEKPEVLERAHAFTASILSARIEHFITHGE